jgi:protein SCO1/2
MMSRARKFAAAATLCCSLLAACSTGQPWQTHDISNLVPDLAFTLQDEEGRRVSAEDYRGKVTLLLFGYTHCPDVCRTTLAEMAQALRASGGGPEDARVLFVTVDPARDTTEIMRAYVHAFGKQFVGLRGVAAATASLARRYRVAFSLGKPDADGQYEVTHGSAVFVFDRAGEARLLFTQKDAPDAIAGDLRRVLAATRSAKG